MSALADDSELALLFVRQFSTSPLAQATSLIRLTTRGTVTEDKIRQVALVALGQMSVSLLSNDASATFVDVFLPVMNNLLSRSAPTPLLINLVDDYVQVRERRDCLASQQNISL